MEETIYSDVLIHVVDRSNPDYQKQMKVVLDLLSKLKVDSPIITVYNKIDKCIEPIVKEENAFYISALTGEGIEELKNELRKYI